MPANITDNFDRADNPSSLGTTTTGQTWEAIVGTWGTSAGNAYNSALDGFFNRVVVESGHSDVLVEVWIGNDGGGVWAVAREDLILYCQTPHFQIQKWNGSGYTAIASSASELIGDGDCIGLECSGSTIKAYLNGVEKLSVTETLSQTKTKHGIGNSFTGDPWFTDFAITFLNNNAALKGSAFNVF